MANLDSIVRTLRFGPLAPLYEGYSVARWKRRGRPVPPPYTVKRQMISEFAQGFGCRVLVETGTYRGDTIWSLRNKFDRLYSIELDRALYDAAVRRFKGKSNITLVQGDSGDKLKEVVPSLNSRTLFWLDGHYCGEGTGLGVEEAPVIRELETVFAHRIQNHIILFDDARLFVGRAGYPKFEELRSWVLQRRPGWTVVIEHDVIQIHPER